MSERTSGSTAASSAEQKNERARRVNERTSKTSVVGMLKAFLRRLRRGEGKGVFCYGILQRCALHELEIVAERLG